MAGIIWAVVGILLLIGFVLWCCIRINHPKTEDEERAKFEQELKDLRNYMNERIKRRREYEDLP